MLRLLRMQRCFFYRFTSAADLRGELLIPQCVPTGRVVLVLKQRLAERGKAAPSATAGAAFVERKHTQIQHVPLNKHTHAVGGITHTVSRS